MTDYLFGDLRVVSTPPLALLPPAPAIAPAPVLTVTRKRGSMRPRAVRAWRHQWRDDAGCVVMGLATTRTGYLLRFPRQCDFAVAADAARIDARPHRHLAPATLEHLLADQVLPRCLAQRGELVAHAAGVAFGTGIALFVGESGRGKSTLAGLFLRAGRAVLTDDCVIVRPTVEAVRAYPTYPSLRLQPDSAAALFAGGEEHETRPSYSDKARLALPDASRHTAGRVAALYFLGAVAVEPTQVRIEPMTPGVACIRLMEQCFQLDVPDRASVARLLQRAGEIVTRVPAFALDYPRDFDRTADLVAQVERHVAALAGRAGPA